VTCMSVAALVLAPPPSPRAVIFYTGARLTQHRRRRIVRTGGGFSLTLLRKNPSSRPEGFLSRDQSDSIHCVLGSKTGMDPVPKEAPYSYGAPIVEPWHVCC
jgi:hypothetical protein